MENKPLFDFTKKYTKRQIAEFLLKYGVNKSMYQYNVLDTPEKIEREVGYMCKDKLRILEHKAKLYNASIIFGGEGNWDIWQKAECDTGYTLVSKYLTEQIVFPQLGITSTELNDVYIPAYRDYLYDNKIEWLTLTREFRKPLAPLLDRLRNIYKDYENSIIGCHVGTKEEAQELFELLKPTYTEYIATIKKDSNFMKFLEEKREKRLARYRKITYLCTDKMVR